MEEALLIKFWNCFSQGWVAHGKLLSRCVCRPGQYSYNWASCSHALWVAASVPLL